MQRLFAIVALLSLPVLSCAESEPEPDIAIIASHDYLGAVAFIDDTRIGEMPYLVSKGTLLDKYLRWRHPDDSPFRDMVLMSVILDPNRLTRGLHRVRLEKPGHPLLTAEFTYPLSKFEILVPVPAEHRRSGDRRALGLDP